MNISNALITLLVILPGVALSAPLQSLNDREKASYCSGVFSEFAVQTSINQFADRSPEREDDPVSYNLIAIAKNLQLRATSLFNFGQDEKMRNNGRHDTEKTAKIAKMAGISTIKLINMDNGIQPCFEFYWDHRAEIETESSHLVAYKALH
ncbi:hypothetical protein EDC56_3486 [Sinobacterium caligoides]|uniref:Uncharacterized protein n=1 Tax=Sinobacterium caligoides TaxID=933926 RepID=A0A3N2DG79_9GAMM|nr:hypothetical protein [Sinobacterium caligoides]ROR98749.1 hypothetical protein EDC56_3486 [Sinobacterium caligoides]